MPPSQLRRRHRALVLGQVRSYGPMTKADISAALGLSLPTIADIVGGFEAEGIMVRDGERRSSGGRKPALYTVRPAGLLAIGVNVDPEAVSAVACDLHGQVQAETSVAHDLSPGTPSFDQALKKVVNKVLADTDQQGTVTGIGVAVPTVVRRTSTGAPEPSDRPDWAGVDVASVLREHWDLPVEVENRAHAIATGEYLFGAGQGIRDQLCLVLGSGLGGAVISGGKLLTGAGGTGGALGRMVLDRQPSLPGTLTASDTVSASAIVAHVSRRLQAGDQSRLAAVDPTELGAADVIDAAHGADGLAVEVLAEVGRTLGAVVAASLCITDSQLVLACGPLMTARELVIGPLREEARNRFPFQLPEIRLGTLGSRAGPLGAAALVLRNHITELERAEEPSM